MINTPSPVNNEGREEDTHHHGEAGILEAVCPALGPWSSRHIIGVPFMTKGGGCGGHAPQSIVQRQTYGGECSLLGIDSDSHNSGLYDKPLSCFGCGIGWFSFILGFGFPPIWFYSTFLYFGNYYQKDPRERAGLAASAIAALICSVAALIVFLAVFL